MDTHVKERLTGAIILVGVLVLLVPELLTGPKRASEPARTNTDEAPLRSYTIDLKDDAGADRAVAPPAPRQPVPADAPMGAEPMGAGSAEVEGAMSAPSAEAEDGEAGEGAIATPGEDASAEVGEPKPAGTPKISADAPASDATAKVDPAPGKVASAAKPAQSQAGTTNVPAASSAGSEVSAPPTAKTAEASASAKAATPDQTRASKPAAGSGYSIQLGSFVSRKNADRLASDLKGKGFSASVSESKSGGRKLYRVRVGPEPDRAAAQALQARLQAIGQKGSLVPAR